MAGISSKAINILENKTRYNGYEQQNKEFTDGSGLEWYDYKNRFYDNQIGRFFCVDRLVLDYPYYTPYQFAGNEVPNAIDLDGLEPYYTHPKQMLFQAGSDLVRGMANIWDRITRTFKSNTTEVESPKDPRTNTSVVSTYEYKKIEGSSLQQWLSDDLGSNKLGSINPYLWVSKTEKKFKPEVKHSQSVGNIEIENRVEIDGSSASTSVTLKNVKAGSLPFPLDISLSGSSSGEGKTAKLEVKNSGNVAIGGNIEISSTNKGSFTGGSTSLFFETKKEFPNGASIKNTTAFGKTF